MSACVTCSPSLVATMILAFGLVGCGAPPDESSARDPARASVAANASDPTAAVQSGELLTGSWTYVPSASCGASQFGTSNGNDLSFAAGGYCSGGNGVPFQGFTFEQPVAVAAGGIYDLTLTLSSFNGWLGFIPTRLTASIAGVTQSAQATTSSAPVIHLTFPIDALPPGTPTITFNIRPPAAGVGPVNGGIFLTEEGCDVHLSLVRTN
jgi:hypothetical protein